MNKRHSSLNINKVMLMLAHTDKQNIRWCVPGDAEKPLRDKYQSRTVVWEVHQLCKLDQNLLIKCQKKTLNFCCNIFGNLLLSETYIACNFVKFVTCAFDTPCESKRSSQIFYVCLYSKQRAPNLNTASRWIVIYRAYSSKLNLFNFNYRIAKRSSTNFPSPKPKAVYTAIFVSDYGLTVWKLCSLARLHTTVGRRSDLTGKYSWITVAFYTGRWQLSWIGKGCVSFSR